MKKLVFYAAVVIIFATSVYTVASYNKNSQINKKTASEKQVSSNSNQAAVSETGSLSVKYPATAFNLKDLNGKEVSLSDLKGKKVFLNFFATWCPPCRGEMPDMQKLYEETKDSDLVILAVDLGEDAKTVQSFADKNKYSFRILIDSDNTVSTKYEIASIPTSYFIDKEGNITAKHIGAMTLQDMRNYIKGIK